MKARHIAAALTWASLLALGNLNVVSILAPPPSLRVEVRRPGLVMRTRELPFETARSPVIEEAAVIPDHLVLPNGEALLRPHVPAPRTRHGWVYPLPEDSTLLPNQIQAGWFQGWTLALPGVGASGPPAVHDGAVYIAAGTGARDMHSLDAMTGIPLWTVRLSEEEAGEPVVSDRYLAIATASGTLFVLSTFNGSLVWSRRHVGAFVGAPMIAGDVLYGCHLGPEGPMLTAAALADGDPLWETPLDGHVLGAPVIQGDAIYAATSEGSIFCIDTATGLERWSEPLGAWSPPHPDGSQIFVACANPWSPSEDRDTPGLLRVTLSAGLPYERVVWGQREAGDHVRLVSRLSVGMGFSGVPAAGYPMPSEARLEAVGAGPASDADQRSDGALPRPWTSGEDICITAQGSIRCADLRGGSLRWEWEPPSDLGPTAIAGTPAVSKDLVVAASLHGDLAGLRRRDGEILWTLRLGERVFSSPVLADGWLYVTTVEGRVFGVDLREPGSSDASTD